MSIYSENKAMIHLHIRLQSLLIIFAFLGNFSVSELRAETSDASYLRNETVMNQDYAEAHREALAASLGEVEGKADGELQKELITELAVINLALRGIKHPSVSTAPVPVAETYESIFLKFSAELESDADGNRFNKKLWMQVKEFLRKAGDASLWSFESEEERRQAEALSAVSTERLEQEIVLEKIFSKLRYTLRNINAEIFKTDFINIFIGLIATEQLLDAIRAKYQKPEENPHYLNALQSRAERKKSISIFREWVYRHWTGETRPLSSLSFSRPDPVGSLGAATAKSLGRAQADQPQVNVKDTFKSVLELLRAKVTKDANRKEMWGKAVEFFEEAAAPATWQSSTLLPYDYRVSEIALTETGKIPQRFSAFFSFPDQDLVHLDVDSMLPNIAMFIYGAYQIKEYPDPEIQPVLEERINALLLFREWVLRFWDQTSGPTNFKRTSLYPYPGRNGKASSLGSAEKPSLVEPLPVPVTFEAILQQLREYRQEIIGRKDSLIRERDDLSARKARGGSIDETRINIVQSLLSADNPETYKMIDEGERMILNALDPSKWIAGDLPQEREETLRLSNLMPRQIDEEMNKIHKFPGDGKGKGVLNYSLLTMTWRDFIGDMTNMFYAPVQYIETMKSMGKDTSEKASVKQYRAKMRLLRMWIYYHWDGQPKRSLREILAPPSSSEGASLGRFNVSVLNERPQAVVFYAGSQFPAQDVITKAVEVVESGKNKNIVFLVNSSRMVRPLRESLKKAGLKNVEKLSIEPNPLLTPGNFKALNQVIERLEIKLGKQDPESRPDIALVLPYEAASQISAGNVLSLALDKAGIDGLNQLKDISEVNGVKKKAYSFAYFTTAWEALSASTFSVLEGRLVKDQNSGIFTLSYATLESFFLVWQEEYKNRVRLAASA